MPEVGPVTLTIRVNKETGALEVLGAEIKGVTGQVAALEGENDKLREVFGHKFEHIALRGFIADAARSAGLGTELRPILSVLQAGITSLEGAFGLAGGGVQLLITGLTALAALAFVVHGHMEKHKEDLAQVLKGYQDTTAALDEYVLAGGRLSAAMEKFAKDTKDATAETLKKIIATNTASVADTQASIAAMKHGEAIVLQTASTEDAVKWKTFYAQKIKEAEREVDKLNATLEANRKGFSTVDDAAKAGTKALDDHKKAADEAAIALKKAQKAAEDFRIEREKTEAAVRIEIGRRAAEEEAARLKVESGLKETEQVAKKAGDQIAGAMSGAFNQAVFEHKSMSQAIQAESKKLAEQIIADLFRIQVAARATKAALAFFTDGASAVGTSAGADILPGVAETA